METGEGPDQWGALFDSISICLSKGLGAPVGSLLLGSREMIDRARRYRKVIGGGMRQAGYLAAAGSYALDHHVARLAKDNARARRIGTLLRDLPWVAGVEHVETNICIFHLAGERTAAEALTTLAEHGIQAVPFGPQTIRFTFHLDVSEADVEALENTLRAVTI